MTPLPRGTRRAYELLRALVKDTRPSKRTAMDIVCAAIEFVKTMENARVRARRRKS